MPRDDEKQLIERAQRGDKSALSELYRRHVDAIYTYICVRVNDPVVVEDLTAEVFLKMLEGLEEYRYTGAPFAAWLYRIAWARTVDYWRRINRHKNVQLSDTLIQSYSEQPQSNPEAIVSTHEEWSDLAAMIRCLTDAQQEVIVLRFVERMKLAEVAAVMDKTVGAIKSLQHRALASLARLMNEREESMDQET